MIKLHGTAFSRAGRCLWALEELGVKYEHVPTPFQQAKSPEHLKLNPNGHVPVLEDDGTVIWESMAINLYLAEKYGKAPLWPASVADHGHVYQWSFWGMTETEGHLLTILRNKMFLPPEQRSEKAIADAIAAMKAPLDVLSNHLKNREYLLGKDFTIADLNVASVLTLGAFIGFDFTVAPKANEWLTRCTSRPASMKTRTMK
ncbi:MAG TPA: glutathione S-transferase family protein [Candidatus Binataceae bacterium]|nr:glutathione S-transferase family protein [Candidatus Binataceae bacterium]